jgi:hypothetical protein
LFFCSLFFGRDPLILTLSPEVGEREKFCVSIPCEQVGRVISKPFWLACARVRLENSMIAGAKKYQKNHSLANLLTSKSICRKFAAKIRDLFQLFFRIEHLFDCARRNQLPC